MDRAPQGHAAEPPQRRPVGRLAGRAARAVAAKLVALASAVSVVSAVSAAALPGCTEANPDYLGDRDGAARPDAHGADLRAHGSSADLGASPAADLFMVIAGAVGDPCATACDCQPGYFCYLGRCAESAQGPVFCCNAAICPPDQACQTPGGAYGQCAASMPIPVADLGVGPPAVDLGVVAPKTDLGVVTAPPSPSYCKYIFCLHDSVCGLSGCGTCDTSKNHCN